MRADTAVACAALVRTKTFAAKSVKATAAGIVASANGTVRASNNTVSKNSIGLAQSGNGVFRSAGNNIVDGNTTETSGTITTFGPM